MNRLPPDCSAWIAEFDRELLRGRSVLLHGNVHDAYSWAGSFSDEKGVLGIEAVLSRHLANAGYAVVAHWDPADGLRCADPAMEPRLAALMAPPAQPAAPAGGRQPVHAVAGSQRLTEIISGIRRALAQNAVPVAIVLHFGETLVADRERQPEAIERQLLVQLVKAMTEAANHDEGPAAGRRNAVIVVSGRLARLPDLVCYGNPHLASVEIPLPDQAERAAFLTAYAAQFHRSEASTAVPDSTVVEAFAQATDGLKIWELEALRRTSMSERLPVERPRDLAAFFRCGERNDPWERLDPTKLATVRSQLGARVKGQEPAIAAIEDMLLDARIGLSLGGGSEGGGRPKGTFFFVGPTGVGKTDLAKGLAEFIFGDEGAIRRWDMSEFQQDHAADRLTGSPPGYIGHESGGELTNWVRGHPFSILLFDEIEKAHPRVLDRFLQILEDGRLTDGQGRTVSFHQSVIIFTSNIGAATLDLAAVAGGSMTVAHVQDHFSHAVRQHFVERIGRPELLNRIGSGIVTFDCLRPAHIDAIAEKFLAQLAVVAQRRQAVELTFPDGAVVGLIHRAMLTGDNLANGGRRVRMLVEDLVKRPLTRWLFEHGEWHGTLAVGVDQAGLITLREVSALMSAQVAR